MRKPILIALFAALLFAVQPAAAQLRSEVPTVDRAPVQLFGGNGTAISLNKLFDPADFRMDHSYEMSAGAFGGSGYSHGMYTNTMRWQPSNQFAARVDVGFLHSPFGSSLAGGPQAGIQNGQFFLRNAEIAYRPTESMQLHLSFRQSPYGGYMSPYGYRGGSAFTMGGSSFGVNQQPLFWKPQQ